MVQRGDVDLQYISMDKQIAYILTKPLSRVKYEYFRDKLGVLPNVHPSSEGGVLFLLMSNNPSGQGFLGSVM
jgi:hypothetical protein